MKLTKTQIRTQLLDDTLAFVLQGGEIQEIPAQKKTIKHTCRAKSSNTYVTGGDAPKFTISGLYNSGE